MKERGKYRKSVIGNNFFVETVNNKDALLLEINTVKGAKEKRTIAVPLDSTNEPMAEHILNYAESLGKKPIWHQTYENLNRKINEEKIFGSLMIPTRPYQEKPDKKKGRKNSKFRTLFRN
ncbi:MAG TPA: hypothetical protein VMW22_07275 [Candidatus Desulfaltia sp.]|nr:hypothetical protein [Candidatus Desulfaltia sp.]